MNRSSSTRLAVIGVATLALAAAALGLVAAKRSGSPNAPSPRAFVHQKASAAGSNAEAAIGPNEVRNPDSTPDVEAYLQRAYPASEITLDQTTGAQSAWAALAAAGSSPGAWQLIGPSTAKVPAVLNVLGDNADYVTAGRVTAMAIGPTCQPGACPVYVGAAGGGIWRTPDGLAGNPQWQFVSGSFATNAIGSLIVDPNDASGNTLLAGTGEPNISVDSEAGMGVYKSTDGGSTWTQLPGSAQFQGRAASSLAIAPDGSILVGIARAVRGVTQSDGGATSNPPLGVAFGVW